MNEIKSLFPKHVYCRDNVCSDHVDAFKEKLVEIKQTNTFNKDKFLNIESSYKLSYNIKDDELFRPLLDEVKESVFNFAQFIGYSLERSFMLELTEVWFNFSDEHDYNWPHIHPGAIISGAYYVENEVDSNNLTFFDNPSSIEYPVETETHHWWGADRYNIEVKKGRLLLFRSDFMHGTTPQIGKGQKITVSFNFK